MKVYSATTPTEAHIVCELLKSQSIDCEVRGEGVFGLQGEVPFGESSEPYVWLIETDKLSTAQSAIEDYKRAHVGDDWKCRDCGETNEPQFGVCWQCGATAP